MKYKGWDISRTENGEWRARKTRKSGLVSYAAPQRTRRELEQNIRETEEWERANSKAKD